MKTLLLLHGAIGAKDQLSTLGSLLQNDYTVHTLDFSGHGDKPLPAEKFSMNLFGRNVLHYMEEKNIPQAAVFGYSMGGYAAMYLAKHYPQKITKLVTLATKFYWNEEIAAKEVKMLDAETIKAKVPAFAEQLALRHGGKWVRLLDKTKELLLDLGKNNTLQLTDYTSITIPCLLLLGEKDKMITKEETEAVFQQLPNATFTPLPATPHPIEQVNMPLLAEEIKKFIG